MKSFKLFLEGRRFEPWRLTFHEYLKMVNPDDTMHGSDAYDWSATGRETQVGGYDRHTGETTPVTIKYSSELDYITISEYDKLLKTINGVEYRMRKEKNRYVKYGDGGERVEDEKGLAVMMTDDEVEKSPKHKLHRKELIAVKDGEVVGVAQDEWGAVLVAVLREFRGKGIGTNLAYLYRSMYPDKGSGGFTYAGQAQLLRVWLRFVKAAVKNGKFQKAVNDGSLDRKQATKIYKYFKKN